MGRHAQLCLCLGGESSNRERKGGVVIGTALLVVLQFVYHTGIDVASLYTWRCLISVCAKTLRLFVSDGVTVLMCVC